MKLIKTSFFSGIITVIRLASGFVISKVLAVLTGPAGVALVGAFSNFITIILAFANGAINTGIVKYTAEFKDETNKLKSLFSTALKISLICSIISGIPLILFSSYLSRILFATSVYGAPILLLGFTIIFYSVNSLLISILNGKEQIKTYTIVNTLGSLIGLLFTICLVYFYKTEGALYAMVITQSLVFFVTLVLVIKSSWFSWSYFTEAFDKTVAIQLSHYSLMAIVSALTVPVSQIILRNLIIHTVGIDEAGYWQGMMRISDGYLMLIVTSLSTYYLPKLSSLKTHDELRKEILNGYKVIIPFVFLTSIIIYYNRLFIINLLYTNNFYMMQNLFFLQLLGDFFKMCAWILAYFMLAKSMTKIYITTEIAFTLTYIVISYFLVKSSGALGVVKAFAISNFLCFLFMVIYFRGYFQRIKD